MGSGTVCKKAQSDLGVPHRRGEGARQLCSWFTLPISQLDAPASFTATCASASGRSGSLEPRVPKTGVAPFACLSPPPQSWHRPEAVPGIALGACSLESEETEAWGSVSILWPGENEPDRDSMKYACGIRLSVQSREHKLFSCHVPTRGQGQSRGEACNSNYEI